MKEIEMEQAYVYVCVCQHQCDIYMNNKFQVLSLPVEFSSTNKIHKI